MSDRTFACINIEFTVPGMQSELRAQVGERRSESAILDVLNPMQHGRDGHGSRCVICGSNSPREDRTMADSSPADLPFKWYRMEIVEYIWLERPCGRQRAVRLVEQHAGYLRHLWNMGYTYIEAARLVWDRSEQQTSDG